MRWKNQRGGFLVEAIVILIMMGIVGPLIYKSRVNKMNELEAMNIAGQMMAVQRGVQRYIEKNFAQLAAAPLPPEGHITEMLTVDDEFMKLMDPTQSLDAKYFDDLLISVRREKINNERFIISAMILGPSKMGGTQITDLIGNQIAAIIGKDGGFIPSDVINPTGFTALGSGGFWSMDMRKYFANNTPFTSRVVARVDLTEDQILKLTTETAKIEPLLSDEYYLWRVQKIENGESLNRMTEVLDMGGNRLKNVGAITPNAELGLISNFRFIALSGETGINLKGNSDRRANIYNAASLEFGSGENAFRIEDRKLTVKAYAFDLNPKGVSSVKEIKVGGRSLSELLPGIMLRDVVRNVRDQDTIPVQTCPKDYTPIIELVPQATKTFCEVAENLEHPRCRKIEPDGQAQAYLEEYFATPVIMPKYNSCRPLKYFRTASDAFGETGNNARLPVDQDGMQTFNFDRASGGKTNIAFAPQVDAYSNELQAAKMIYENLPNVEMRVHGGLTCVTPLKDKEGYVSHHNKLCSYKREIDEMLTQDFQVLQTETVFEETGESLPRFNVCKVYVTEIDANTQDFVDSNPPLVHDAGAIPGKRYYYYTDKFSLCNPSDLGQEQLHKKVQLKQRRVINGGTKIFPAETCQDKFTLFKGDAPQTGINTDKYWDLYSISPAQFEMGEGKTLNHVKGTGTQMRRYNVFLDENRSLGNGTPLRELQKVPVVGSCTDYGVRIEDIKDRCVDSKVDIPGYNCAEPEGETIGELKDKHAAFKLSIPYPCITEWVDVKDEGNGKTTTYARRLVDVDNIPLTRKMFEEIDVGGTFNVKATKQGDLWKIDAVGIERMDAKLYCRQTK